MKCRKWGHFVNECQSDKDACGTCGDQHRTSNCTNKGKLYCVSCGDNSHPSWSRNCPEFTCRCAIQDERIPENAMPYFPTEHDWTLTERPSRIPLDKRFPGKYAVNSLPSTVLRRSNYNPHPPRRNNNDTSTAHPPQKCSTHHSVILAKENPNLIPLNHSRKEGELPGTHEDRNLGLDRPGTTWDSTDEEQYLMDRS